MYNEEDYLQLSGIQHFSFCKRQWALIHVEEKWTENFLTADGRQLHDRVHNKDVSEKRNNKITLRGLNIKSSKLGVSGTCDAVEFIKIDENAMSHDDIANHYGVTLHGYTGTWQPFPVEYKRGKSKANDCDKLQAAAQVICLEEMLSCHIDTAYIFYFESRKREKIDISQELREKVYETFEEMHGYMKKGYTPKVRPSKSCESCSLFSECMPTLLKKQEKVDAYIERHIKETSHEKNA